MDYILCLLLVSAIIVLGVPDYELYCDEHSCNGTDTNYFNKTEVTLGSCRNLTVLQLTPNTHTLQIWNCNGDAIEDISQLAKLSYLVLHGGNFVELSDYQFAKLSLLELLLLPANGIERVHANAFKGLPKLYALSLDNNSLTSLPDKAFESLPGLKYLFLGANKFRTLQESIFTQNPKLTVLHLDGNPLTKLSPKTLEVLTELVMLDLSNSSFLHELQVHSTESLVLNNSGISRLDILGSVNKVLAENNQIEVLNIDNKIPVTELDLHGNKLESYLLPGILVGMWRLQRLDLSMNLIGDLPSFKGENSGETLILPNLRFVNLSGNRLEHLRGDSPMLSPSLTHLDLSYNMIRVIEPHVFGLVNNLQSLRIEGNLIRHFKYDRFFNEQRGLKEVALYENEFSNESYRNITRYFTAAGVLVIEKTQFAAVETSGPEASEDWSSWDVLIFVCLLVALAFNVLLFRRLKQKGKGIRRSSRMKARFVSLDVSEN